jgi:hypothetical protein
MRSLPQTVTRKELAAIPRVSDSTIRRMERSGLLADVRLPAMRYARYWTHKVNCILGLDHPEAKPESPAAAKPSRFKRRWEPKPGTYSGMVDCPLACPPIWPRRRTLPGAGQTIDARAACWDGVILASLFGATNFEKIIGEIRCPDKLGAG